MFFYLSIISIATTMLLFFSIKSFLFKFYLVVNFILFTLPAIIELLFGVTHPMHDETSNIYNHALFFVILWNIFFATSFHLAQKIIPSFFQISNFLNFSPINHPYNYQSVYFSSLVLISISVIAKWKLFTMGGFQMSGVASTSPLLQLYKLFSIFDLLVLIFIGEYKKGLNQSIFNRFFYYVVILLVLVFALASGSRGQIIYALLVIAVSHREFFLRHLSLTIASASLLLPFLFVIFPFMAFLRNNNFDFYAAFDRLSLFMDGLQLLMLDVLTTRLNYLEILGKVMVYVDEFGYKGGVIYFNNFIGIIPRAIWPGKPAISNDSHQLGHDLGLLQATDITTSIGLRPLGEAFYELGYFGLGISVLMGFLYAFFQNQFLRASSSSIAFAIYFYLIIYLVGRDGIFALIPGLIYVFIGWVIFFGIMRFFGIFFRQILGQLNTESIYNNE
jgi:hypothetical protein